MTQFVTPNGKEIEIVREPKSAFFKIQFKSGGELPASLAGLFTTLRFAEVAVIDYLNSLPKKVEKKPEEPKVEKKPTKEE